MEQTSDKAGSFYIIGLGFFIALVGAVFMYLMWNSYQQANHTRSWDKTAAVMIKSTMDTRSAEHVRTEYRWDLEYVYSFENKDYTSIYYKPRGAKWTSRKREIEALVNSYYVGNNVFCYVNPSNPQQAILEHDTKAAGYSIWFPGLFVIGGLGMIINTVRKMIPC